MARMKIGELRGMPEGELKERIVSARRDLAAMRLRASQGVLEQPHQMQQLRRDVARMLTILQEQDRQHRTKS